MIAAGQNKPEMCSTQVYNECQFYYATAEDPRYLPKDLAGWLCHSIVSSYVLCIKQIEAWDWLTTYINLIDHNNSLLTKESIQTKKLGILVMKCV